MPKGDREDVRMRMMSMRHKLADVDKDSLDLYWCYSDEATKTATADELHAMLRRIESIEMHMKHLRLKVSAAHVRALDAEKAASGG